MDNPCLDTEYIPAIGDVVQHAPPHGKGPLTITQVHMNADKVIYNSGGWDQISEIRLRLVDGRIKLISSANKPAASDIEKVSASLYDIVHRNADKSAMPSLLQRFKSLTGKDKPGFML